MLQFYKERHGSGDYKGMSFKDHAQLMHKEWTALSAAERQVCSCNHLKLPTEADIILAL
jgi:hypothetical protein